MKKLKHISFIGSVMASVLFLSCSKDSTPPTLSTHLSIPDEQFETMLIEQGIDSDGEVNQKILRSDAAKVSRLDVSATSNLSIDDLTGIEGFTQLTYLAATHNNLKEIDLKHNPLLDTLYLTGNLLTSIDLSHNPNLVWVLLESNELTSIEGLDNVTKLKRVDASFNYIEELEINNASIEALYASHNELKNLDIKAAPHLKTLFVKTNQLSTLDLSKNTALELLALSDNQLQQLDLESLARVKYLYLSSNALTHLNISHLPNLVYLTTHNNPDLSCILIEENQSVPNLSKSDHQQLSPHCN